MTVQEIITEVRQIVQELDPNNTHAGDNVIVGWINACTLQLCSTISTLPKVSISNIVAAATVTFPTNALKMDYASITDGATPAVHSNLETIDFVNFARISPGWEDQPVSKPQYLVRMTDLTWMMWPNPNATWTGKALTLIGTILPTPLAYPADLSNNPGAMPFPSACSLPLGNKYK